MKKLTIAAVAAFALATGVASAADIVTKGPRPVVVPDPPAWDLAFGSAVTNDYIFRGVTQSNHKPAVAAYFEPRYNFNKDHQLYAGIGGASISFPNRAAAEVDFYAGYRPTFGKLAFDFGAWYYYYPGGQCFSAIANGNTFDCSPSGGAAFQALPNGNAIKKDLSFYEIYGKVNWSVTDNIVLGAYAYYSPSVLNSGANGVFYGGTAKYTWAAWSNGVQPYISAEVGRWSLGTSDSFYGLPGTNFAGGIPYADYTTWNAGFGWTWKVFTVDLRYIDTNLNKGNCNAFTSDQTAGIPGTTANITPINPTGVGSNWCSGVFTARLSADLTINSNLK
jgi:uncharacterized protein (TIGR02001 family)